MMPFLDTCTGLSENKKKKERESQKRGVRAEPKNDREAIARGRGKISYIVRFLKNIRIFI